MDKTVTTAAPETKEESSIAGKVLRIAAFPIAALSGYWAASVSVHNNAYNMAKTLGAFDDILAKTTPESKRQIKDLIAKRLDKAKFWTQAMTTKNGYQDAADARLLEMGVDSFMKKWDYMAKAGKYGVVRAGLAGTGIALGAILAVANSKTFSGFFSAHSKQEERVR